MKKIIPIQRLFSFNRMSFFLIFTFLIFTKCENLYSQNTVPDLTGVYEGEQINGNLVMYYKICLSKTGPNTYGGFDYCRWQRNRNNTPLNVRGELPNAKKVFYATFDGDVLLIKETKNIEGSNWDLSDERFVVINNNGTLELKDNNISQPGRRFHLHRISHFYPREYDKYIRKNY